MMAKYSIFGYILLSVFLIGLWCYFSYLEVNACSFFSCMALFMRILF